MSKERLDEIVDDLLNNRLELTSFVSENLEQAERVQELEKIKDAKIALVNKGDEEKRYVEQERMIELEKRNKHYRELLESVIDNGQCSTIDNIVKELYVQEGEESE